MEYKNKKDKAYILWVAVGVVLIGGISSAFDIGETSYNCNATQIAKVSVNGTWECAEDLSGGVSYWNKTGTEMYPASQSYWVGIGNTYADAPLHIQTTDTDDVCPIIIQQNSYGDATLCFFDNSVSPSKNYWVTGLDNDADNAYRISWFNRNISKYPRFTLEVTGQAEFVDDLIVDELIICNNGTTTIMTRNASLATLRGCTI